MSRGSTCPVRILNLVACSWLTPLLALITLPVPMPSPSLSTPANTNFGDGDRRDQPSVAFEARERSAAQAVPEPRRLVQGARQDPERAAALHSAARHGRDGRRVPARLRGQRSRGKSIWGVKQQRKRGGGGAPWETETKKQKGTKAAVLRAQKEEQKRRYVKTLRGATRSKGEGEGIGKRSGRTPGFTVKACRNSGTSGISFRLGTSAGRGA